MSKRCTLILLLGGLVTSALSWAELPLGEKPDASTSDVATQATEQPAAKVAPPIPAEVLKIGEITAKFGKLDGTCTTWNIGCVPAGDTITRDEGGVRSALAKYHIGFIGFFSGTGGYNFAQAPQNPQVYNYEKPDWDTGALMWVTYNFPSATKMQFVTGGIFQRTSYSGIAGYNIFRPTNAYLHQELFNGKLAYTIGWLNNDTFVYGGYIAGNLASGTLGVNAVIPYEVGMGYTPYIAPAVVLKYKFKNGLYAIADIQRSQDPNGTRAGQERDKLGFRLIPHGDGALYMPEIGYQKVAAPGVKEIWFRATGFYNASHYQDYSSVNDVYTGVKGHNGAGSVVFEQQITQPDKYLAYRGLYWTATTQGALPDYNVYEAYYQFALYSLGLFHSRPLDLMIFNVNRTQFSRTVLNTFQQLPHSSGAQMGVPAYDDSTSISGTYGYHICPGTSLNAIFSYTRHPTFAPKLDNPVTGILKLNFNF
jgi:porin